MKPQNTTQEQRDCIKMLSVLVELRAQRASMTVSQAIALMHVAINEGMSVGDLAIKIGLKQSVMSRHLLDLGPFTRSREPGANLVEHRVGTKSLRVHEMFLTPKGAGFFRRIANLCGSARPTSNSAVATIPVQTETMTPHQRALMIQQSFTGRSTQAVTDGMADRKRDLKQQQNRFKRKRRHLTGCCSTT